MMPPILTIPHRPAAGMCPVNGIRDLVAWRCGRDWSNEFVHGLGLGGGFAYLRINPARPPRQVYWGNSTPRQHAYLAGLLDAGMTEVDGRSFKFAWGKATAAVDAGTPPVLGPLDMFHLRFYDGIYQRLHIPIHYELLVGYGDDEAYVQDTGFADVQEIPLAELQSAWDVNVPGMGKRNRLVILEVPGRLAPVDELIRRSVADQCRVMLHPPVSMLGLPAMKKVARDIAHWGEELGAETTDACLRQVREYLNSPPSLEGDHLTAGRDRYVTFLREAGPLAGLDFSAAIDGLCESQAVVPRLAEAIRRSDLQEAAAGFARIADIEARAFAELSTMVGAGDDVAAE
jgi:hypothetical protein